MKCKHTKISTISKMIFIVVALFFLCSAIYILFLDMGLSLEKIGQAGDASAIANTIFSGGALIGVVVSLFLQRADLKNQREDLNLQREELKLTNVELKQQRKELQKQNSLLELERIETTIFNMISSYSQLTNDIEYKYEDHSVKGKEVFRVVRKQIEKEGSVRKDTIINRINEKDLFDHYFRYLYRMIKVIDDLHFSDDKKEDHEKKYFYTSIIRSLLTSDEQFLIFYDGLSTSGSKFKILIEKYSLLDGIRETKVRAFSQWILYKESAFEQSKYKISRSDDK